MILFAAVVPPPSVVEAALAEVERALAPAAEPRRRWWQRGAAPAPVSPAATLTLVPADRVVLPVARFGNLTTPDARRLSDALALVAPQWSRPTLRVVGASLWPSSRIPQLALDVEGDVDTLRHIARDVRVTAESLGLYLDRRDFRPAMAVAPAPTPEAAARVEAVAAAMAGHAGEPWTADRVSLLRQVADGSPMIDQATLPLPASPGD